MDPLTGIALGVGALSSLSSMLGGARAQSRARAARAAAIGDYVRQSSALMGLGGASGDAELSRVAGRLGDVLGVSGRALGSALAGAGVWNASSVAGTLSRQAEANASVLGELSRVLGEARLASRGRVLDRVTDMRLGGADADWSAGVAQRAEGLSGLGALAQVLGQMEVGKKKPGVGGGAVGGDAVLGKSNNARDALLRLGTMQWGLGR
jgi:hypothetical protein